MTTASGTLAKLMVGWYTDADPTSEYMKLMQKVCQEARVDLTRLGSPDATDSYQSEMQTIKNRGVTCILFDVWGYTRSYHKTYCGIGPNQLAYRLMLDLAIDTILLGDEHHGNTATCKFRNNLPVCKFRPRQRADATWVGDLAALIKSGTPYFREGLAKDLEAAVQLRQDILRHHSEKLKQYPQ